MENPLLVFLKCYDRPFSETVSCLFPCCKYVRNLQKTGAKESSIKGEKKKYRVTEDLGPDFPQHGHCPLSRLPPSKKSVLQKPNQIFLQSFLWVLISTKRDTRGTFPEYISISRTASHNGPPVVDEHAFKKHPGHKESQLC